MLLKGIGIIKKEKTVFTFEKKNKKKYEKTNSL